MAFLMHSAVHIDSVHFNARELRQIEWLGASPEVVRQIADTSPHGVVRGALAVGGYTVEHLRYRGFNGVLPASPHLMDVHHLKTYQTALDDMRAHAREDQLIAAACGTIAGGMLGFMGMGVAVLFTHQWAITLMPATLLVPGALAFWLPERVCAAKKAHRLEVLATMVRGLADSSDAAVWQDAMEAAALYQAASDPLLARAAVQFNLAKEALLPRYEDDGACLPAYYPPSAQRAPEDYAALPPPPPEEANR